MDGISGADVLVVDDEASVVEVVGLYLRKEGFQVRSASNGRQALEEIREQRPELIVLDVMLPEIDGIEIIRRLREDRQNTIPVIMLTARGQEIDRIYGLELGADDYVTKPFSPAELVARVKAVLRRSGGGGLPRDQQAVTHGELSVDPTTRTVTLAEKDIELTATEFNLLWFLICHPRQVFSRDRLLENVWGYSEYVDPSTVTVHIRRLREKIEDDPSSPKRLLTVWGVGYKFEPGVVK
ncbi:MAG: response regulator transcription factor [Candidatus Promineifilaceae bacterium]